MRAIAIARKAKDVAKREVVCVIAAVLAAVSCFVIPPDAQYASYVDWHTLALLFCLMLVVAGFRKLGVLDAIGLWIVNRTVSQRAVVGALVALSFVASMLVTNDVALITFVPLCIVTLRAARMEHRICLAATLMTIAANLGSMLMPIGNPQNLYLFTASGMGVGDFIALMTPYTLASAALLALVVAIAFKEGVPSEERADDDKLAGEMPLKAPRDALVSIANAHAPVSEGSKAQAKRGPASTQEYRKPYARRQLLVYATLFALCIAAVAGVVSVWILLAIVLIIVAALDAKLLQRVDYGLLLTFVFLFVFVGNIGRLPLLNAALQSAVSAGALPTAVLASQLISNVPAAILLSGFTNQWQALIVGTNLGGLGTLIASMASLITFKALAAWNPNLKLRYLGIFTALNVAFLAALMIVAYSLGAWGI